MAYMPKFGRNADSDNGPAKPAGYVNVFLPREDGSRMRLGSGPRRVGITLYAENIDEAALLEWLSEDPTRVATLMASAEFTFQGVVAGEDKARVVLPAAVPPTEVGTALATS